MEVSESKTLVQYRDLFSKLDYFKNEGYRKRFIDKVVSVAKQNFKPIFLPVMAEDFSKYVDTISVDKNCKFTEGRQLTWEQAEDVKSKTFLEALRQIQHYLEQSKKHNYYAVKLTEENWLTKAMGDVEFLLHVPDEYSRQHLNEKIKESDWEKLPKVVTPTWLEYDFQTDLFSSKVECPENDKIDIAFFFNEMIQCALDGYEISCASVDDMKLFAQKNRVSLNNLGLEIHTFFDKTGIPPKMKKKATITRKS
jgi:hypothetical protein